MPFALITFGILLIVAGARGTYSDLKKLLISDFTGEGNFFYWIATILAVGSLGYIPAFEKFSRAFMALIIIAMLLSQDGLFERLTAAIQSVGQPSGEAPTNDGTSKDPNAPGFGSSIGSFVKGWTVDVVTEGATKAYKNVMPRLLGGGETAPTGN